MCGSPASIDATGCSESYGRAWQTITAECTNSNGEYCGMYLTLHADMCDLDSAWFKIIDLWNSLGKH